MSLKKIRSEWSNCDKCELAKTRSRVVFYRGAEPCDLLFIGEAPGFSEDLTGKPFTGASGRLLDDWIDQLPPIRVGIANILGCLPIGEDNKIRPPKKQEAELCKGRLHQIIEAVHPSMVCMLGKIAKKYHKIQPYLADLPSLELQHPAYVLRKGGTESVEYKKNLIYLQEFVEENHAQEETLCGNSSS